MYEFFTWQLPIVLQLAVVVIAVVCSIGYNDMVHKEEAHDLASLLHIECEHVILSAWFGVATWVVVCECHDSGITLHGFFDYQPHVYGCFSKTALAEFHVLEHFKVLVHQNDVRLFLQQESKKGRYSLEQQPSIKNKLKTNNLKTINNKK